jgi:hypothetical protein
VDGLAEFGAAEIKKGNYIEAMSSSDKTWALVARLRARVQSPSCPAERASPMNPFTFAARSDCVVLSLFPWERARFFSATLRLASICCRAEVVSAGVNCGAITGASGFLLTLFSGAGGGVTCGRVGSLRTASAGGGGGSSNRKSGTGSILASVTAPGVGKIVAGTFGRSIPAPRQVLVLFLRGLQPLANCTTHTHKITNRHVCWRVVTEQSWGLLVIIYAARGNSIRKVVPRPTSEVKSIEPL